MSDIKSPLEHVIRREFLTRYTVKRVTVPPTLYHTPTQGSVRWILLSSSFDSVSTAYRPDRKDCVHTNTDRDRGYVTEVDLYTDHVMYTVSLTSSTKGISHTSNLLFHLDIPFEGPDTIGPLYGMV